MSSGPDFGPPANWDDDLSALPKREKAWKKYPLVCGGIAIGVCIVIHGVYGWKSRTINSSQYLQRYRVASSTPVVLGALLTALTDSPGKRAMRRKKEREELEARRKQLEQSKLGAT
ncbi:uncharacterized protein LOC141858056 [Brevipalpus obovatus]|uniref:uncharacterized protein LOC141858056 n=1 Tax=Brevipalpus obovatus TaxID=246614 RepID=UPI003D9DEB7B